MESEANMSATLDSENIFCTILSKTRVYQGLALLSSLKQVMAEDFSLFIHCIDQASYKLLNKMKLENVHFIREKRLDESIRNLKQERRIHEYCWTLKPVICDYVLATYPSVKRITYLDSDLYFWSDPTSIFKKQSDCSVLLSIEEKYRPNMNQRIVQRKSRITGLYNSGFISFKNDEIGVKAVKWWREKCLEACRIAPEEGIFGDQKYLDEMPSLFSTSCDIATPGVNVGPWNVFKYQFSNVNDSVCIDEHLLVFYHFSGLRVVAKDKVEFVYRVNRRKLPFIYSLYIKAIAEAIELAAKLDPDFNGFADEAALQRYWN
jgi:hypothetical protein